MWFGRLTRADYLERQQFPRDTERPKMFSAGGMWGHCLNRPIAVRGAAPGDMLAVHIVLLTPDAWCWTSTPGPDSPVARQMSQGWDAKARLLWEIDAKAGTATANGKYTRSLASFLAVTDVAPAGPGVHSTVPLRTAAGGNIDCKELTAGSTIYLPVNVNGALLYLGDGHAAQGDGESGHTAIERGMTTEAIVSIAADRPLELVHAKTPAGRITFGFHADLNEAMGDALDAMVTWLAAAL